MIVVDELSGDEIRLHCQGCGKSWAAMGCTPNQHSQALLGRRVAHHSGLHEETDTEALGRELTAERGRRVLMARALQFLLAVTDADSRELARDILRTHGV